MALIKDIIIQNQDKIEQATKDLVIKYTDSPYHTNAGKFLRFVSKFIPVSTILKLLQAKINK